MENDDFCVERRVCVDMSKIRATKKFSRGFQPTSINLVQGNVRANYRKGCICRFGDLNMSFQESEVFCLDFFSKGSLTMENMGKLSEYSDTKQALYPINYRFVCFNMTMNI